MSSPLALVLSAGSELVSISLVDDFSRLGIPFGVVGFGDATLCERLHGARTRHHFPALEDDPELRRAFVDYLKRLGAESNGPIVLYPTEDSTLRLLIQCAAELAGVAEYSRCRKLSASGLDKAELFAYLETNGLGSLLPRTVILDSAEDAERAWEVLGDDAVFKPALKPWDMNMSEMGAKIVTRRFSTESKASVLARLRKSFHYSNQWLGQERLRVDMSAERSVWANRDSTGAFVGMEVVEVAKYPSVGGTACLVRVDEDQRLVAKVEKLLACVDHVGLAEVAFLPDAHGEPKLIEVNARPWLQVGLAAPSGCPLVEASVCSLAREKRTITPGSRTKTQWLQPERFLLSLAREPGRIQKLRSLSLSGANTYFSVYSSGVPKVKWLWLTKLLKTAVRKLFSPLHR